MWNKTLPALSVIILLVLSACSKHAVFAYKTFDMDTYRNMGESFEFSSDKPFDWVCTLTSNPGKRVTVIIQKKELVWVDVMKEAQDIKKKDLFVHGRIEGLDPGDYRIVLVGDNNTDKAAAEYEFRLYNGEYPEKSDDE